MIRRSDSTALLTAAMVEFQKAMPPVLKDAKNPHFGNKFASLGAITHAAAPVLAEIGLVVTQFPSADQDGRPTLITSVQHVSGEFMEAEMQLVMSKADPQGQGSGLTYARRYAYCAVLGIVADEDDDAEKAVSRPRPKPTYASAAAPEQTEYINGDLIPIVPDMEISRSGPPSDLATPKQVGFAKKLLEDAGMADADIAAIINTDCPPWTGAVNTLTKKQISHLIEMFKS